MRPFLHTTVLAASCLLASVAEAATVYRWVDDRGQVHYSDAVPERYRSRAQPVQPPAAEPTPAQRNEALERAQDEKAKALARPISPVGAPASAPPASAASAPATKRPAQVPNEQTDCETWQRLYMESLACFGPYRTVRGGVKPEAFEVCNVVPEPPPPAVACAFPEQTRWGPSDPLCPVLAWVCEPTGGNAPPPRAGTAPCRSGSGGCDGASAS
ncbi:DUF4124 domain-containing protein [Aquabacterium sp.]|jgi:hypothetical protein|uniref:DUF4124 domain-containing protein n=1 Tax=Aquabacterium sp. TaxID=1872578 RepID=UPI0039B738B3